MGIWLKSDGVYDGNEVEVEGVWLGEEVSKAVNVQALLNNVDEEGKLLPPDYADVLSLSAVKHRVEGSLTLNDIIPAGKMTLYLLREFVRTTQDVYMKVTVGDDVVVSSFSGNEWRKVVISEYKLTPMESRRQGLVKYSLVMYEVE